jgi:permuted papain-like amidase YaeF/Yiix C92 family enzyme
MYALARARACLMDAVVLYLAAPIKHALPTCADASSLAAVLECGDVLLSHGNTRVAAVVKLVTGSPWSHVSMYVGPLEDGPDPRCIVEADIAAGVRSIRLSELNALQVRVLRPIGLDDGERHRLAQWVIGRIGSEYDLAHAWALARRLLLPARSRSLPETIAQSASRFICCSLLAHAFARVGAPIRPDPRSLTPGDFERASVFDVVLPLGSRT